MAIRFLTVLPAGPRGRIPDADLGSSLLWFPIAGLVIGVILLVVHALASRVLPPPAVVTAVVLAWVVVTGALHLDGLGDVCDGLYGARAREERLRIMKDPHVGAMAVVGIATCLLMKFALVSSLSATVIHQALLVVPCLGRHAMVLLATTLPPARGGEGTAAPFVQHGRKRSLIGATIMTLAVCVAMLDLLGLALFGVAVAGGLLMRSVFQRTLGGISGDALGAAGELTEVLGLFVIVLATG